MVKEEFTKSDKFNDALARIEDVFISKNLTVVEVQLITLQLLKDNFVADR